MSSKSLSLLPAVAGKLPGTNKVSGAADPVLKIGPASSILGVSRVTIRRRVADGTLPHLRIKGRLYFKKSDLHAYIEAHRGNLGG